MTEEIQPTPTLAPMPVTGTNDAPGAKPPRNPWPRRLLIGCGALFVIAALTGCAVFGAWYARFLYENRDVAAAVAPVAAQPPYVPAETPSSSSSPPMSEAKPKVAWFGSDRYLAIQTSHDTILGTQMVPVPRVIVWDRETGRSEVVGDYVLVGVEKAHPTIYLHAESDLSAYGDPYFGADERPPYDQYDDLFDNEPWEFYSWSPSHLPSMLGGSRISWSTWKGPGKNSVEAVVNADNGAAPIDLFFSAGGERIQANTYGFFSCEPVGWSPSGAYFAVVTLQDAYSEFYQQFDALADAAMLQALQNRVIVYSAADGKVVYEVPLGTGRAASVSSAVMWDSSSDVLYHQVLDSQSRKPFTEITNVRLVAVDLTGAKSDIRMVGIPETWRPGGWSFIGTQRDGARVLEAADGSPVVWRLLNGTLTKEGPLDLPAGVVSLAVARDGALARLSPAELGDDAPLQCEFSESIHGPARVIWKDK